MSTLSYVLNDHFRGKCLCIHVFVLFDIFRLIAVVFFFFLVRLLLTVLKHIPRVMFCVWNSIKYGLFVTIFVGMFWCMLQSLWKSETDSLWLCWSELSSLNKKLAVTVPIRVGQGLGQPDSCPGYLHVLSWPWYPHRFGMCLLVLQWCGESEILIPGTRPVRKHQRCVFFRQQIFLVARLVQYLLSWKINRADAHNQYKFWFFKLFGSY
jgi:hypothetical protein